MATWEDGPEYAPRVRPDSFAGPPVAPLEIAPAVAQPAAGAPTQRPRFDQPGVPVAALATLVPPPPDLRDPHRPFDVASSAMTGDSAWSSVNWNASQPVSSSAPQPSPPIGSWSSQPTWPPPQQPLQVSGPVNAPGGFPSPGTPAWFAPPPPYGEQSRPGKVGAQAVFQAATPGLCILLALGGVIYVLAPVVVVVGLVLSRRVQVAQPAVRVAFVVGTTFVGLVALIGLFTDAAVESGWWSFVAGWSDPVCWVLLLVLLSLVWRALRRQGAPPPGDPGHWG